MKIIDRRAQVPEALKHFEKAKLEEYVQKFQEGNDPKKINYFNLIDDIQNYSFTFDGEVPESAHSVMSGLTDIVGKKEQKTIWDADYIVLDQRKVPQNQIEMIETKMIKINRRLKQQFKGLDSFDKKLKADVKADKNGNVTVDQLREFVLGIIEDDMINLKITKRDVEGFLSAFSYNAYGSTNIDSISKLIYTRDD